jgi:hypothetical protein
MFSAVENLPSLHSLKHLANFTQKISPTINNPEHATRHPRLPRLHFSLQYFTSFQTFSHFFLHLKGLRQTTHIFSGRSDFFTCFIFVYLIFQETFPLLQDALLSLFPAFYQRSLSAFPDVGFSPADPCAHA